MKQVRDIVKLHSDMSLSIRKIQGATGVAKSTVADYIKRFKVLHSLECITEDSKKSLTHQCVKHTYQQRNSL